MPRPTKCRRVCSLPSNAVFLPVKDNQSLPITLLVDEYETIRLIDKEGFSQEECGDYMQIARTTVQQIYTSARKKIAEALVEGRSIQITGGQYVLCHGNEFHDQVKGCHKHCHNYKRKHKEDER
ncbi:MAG: DUF134 domain-containing protein [Erysipelotrichaceae bacterium]